MLRIPKSWSYNVIAFFLILAIFIPNFSPVDVGIVGKIGFATWAFLAWLYGLRKNTIDSINGDSAYRAKRAGRNEYYKIDFSAFYGGYWLLIILFLAGLFFVVGDILLNQLQPS